jgi:flagellin
MTVINTNIKSLYTQAALKLSERDGKVAMQQLATGKRINSAKDDAAGLAISARMTQQIKGLNQASRNAGDAISFVQTVDGATAEVTNMLQRMSELAVQASNATYSDEQRGFLDLEFQQLKQEIVRISNTHEWNGFKIMNGTAGDPIGPAPVTVTSPTRSLAATEMNINGTPIRAPLDSDDPFSDTTAGSSVRTQSAIAIAAAINASQGTTGVRAIPTGPVTSGNVTTIGDESDTQHLYLNGIAVPIDMGTGLTGSADSPDARRAKVIAAVNNTIATHGVTASDSGAGGISLTTKDGRNLSAWFDSTDNKLSAASFGLGTTSVAKGTVTVGSVSAGAVDITFNTKPVLGETISVTANRNSVAYVVSTGDMTSGVVDYAKLMPNLVSALGNNPDFSGVAPKTVTATHGTTTIGAVTTVKLTLTGGTGVTDLSPDMKVYPPGASGVTGIEGAKATSTGASTIYGTVTLRSESKPIIVNLSTPSGKSGGAVTLGNTDQAGNKVQQTSGRMSFQVGPAANQLITFDLQDFGKNGSITGEITADVDSAEPSVNIKSVAAANAVIDKVARAMDNVNSQRSTMGAIMNRLEHVIDNLNTVSMNAEASRSQIEDADYAKASTELARTQIMQQAATAVLAQANTSQQTVLKLLQG